MAGKYFLERESMTSASKMFEQYRPIQFGPRVTTARSIRKRFWSRCIRKAAGFSASTTPLPEDRPGADLSEEAARQIAAAFAATRGIELSGMELKESTSEKKKARRDHMLAWEARQGDPRNLDEAHYRVEIKVAGDRVSSWRSFWKLPETYTRSREQQQFHFDCRHGAADRRHSDWAGVGHLAACAQHPSGPGALERGAAVWPPWPRC